MPLIIEGKECACLGDPTSHGTPLAPGVGAVNVLYNGRPIWRVGVDSHLCPLFNGPVPHGAGVVMIGALRTMVGGSLAARKTDIVVEPTGGPNPIVPGAFGMSVPNAPGGGAMGMSAPDAPATPSTLTVEAFESPAVAGISQETHDADHEATVGDALQMLFQEYVLDRGRDLRHRITGDYAREEYSTGVYIEGTEAFRKQAREQLDEIHSKPSGQNLLAGFSDRAKGGKTVTIKETSELNGGCMPDSLEDSRPKEVYAFGDGGEDTLYVTKEAGPGTSSTIRMNPQYRSGPPDRPVSTTLFHEMVHAQHNADGENLNGQKYDDHRDNAEEARTIGAPPYEAESPSEREYLSEHGKDYHRIDHTSTYHRTNEDGLPEGYSRKEGRWVRE